MVVARQFGRILYRCAFPIIHAVQFTACSTRSPQANPLRSCSIECDMLSMVYYDYYGPGSLLGLN
jgi:hypothetical protein